MLKANCRANNNLVYRKSIVFLRKDSIFLNEYINVPAFQKSCVNLIFLIIIIAISYYKL